MWSRENLADMLFVFRMRKTVYRTVIKGFKRAWAVDKHIQKTKFALFVTFKDSHMASSNLNDKKT